MRQLLLQLLRDEAGFIISAELILVVTITVLATVVGLTEVSGAINNELVDVANAFGSLNQSFSANGNNGRGNGRNNGSGYQDQNSQQASIGVSGPEAEG